MAAIERGDMLVRDMDALAALFKTMYVEHVPAFRCPDPARVHGMVRSGAAGGLQVSRARYGGFTYSARISPANSLMACVYLDAAGAVIATAREELRVTAGSVHMMPSRLPAIATIDNTDDIVLQVPWTAARALAEETVGLPAARLRFEAMAPVSTATARTFTATAEFIYGQLVTSGATAIHSLIVPELTRMAAAVFLHTFPNTTMTLHYLPGPGWVPSAAVHRAAAFIDEHASQPVTVAQIAAAAGVTPRALQYAFRRHHGTTPTGYLRQARLERAHRELRSAQSGDGVTVADVARKWGWAGRTQFTAAYRQRFGTPPSSTLRSGR
jgi:AraC-like DNA-binding protein